MAFMQKHSLLGLVIIWVANAKMQVLTMDMIQFKKAHTGVNLVKMIGKSLQEFSVIDKPLLLPSDNASNNITMSQSLKDAGKLPSTHIAGPTTCVLCAGHIFDLANKVIFQYFSKKAKLDNDNDNELDAEEEELLEELSSDHHDTNKDAILEDLLDAVDNLQDLKEEDGNIRWNAIMKIFKLGHWIFNNSAMQQAL